jgi:hypothetical protein
VLLKTFFTIDEVFVSIKKSYFSSGWYLDFQSGKISQFCEEPQKNAKYLSFMNCYSTDKMKHFYIKFCDTNTIDTTIIFFFFFFFFLGGVGPNIYAISRPSFYLTL